MQKSVRKGEESVQFLDKRREENTFLYYYELFFCIFVFFNKYIICMYYLHNLIFGKKINKKFNLKNNNNKLQNLIFKKKKLL